MKLAWSTATLADFHKTTIPKVLDKVLAAGVKKTNISPRLREAQDVRIQLEEERKALEQCKSPALRRLLSSRNTLRNWAATVSKTSIRQHLKYMTTPGISEEDIEAAVSELERKAASARGEAAAAGAGSEDDGDAAADSPTRTSTRSAHKKAAKAADSQQALSPGTPSKRRKQR